MTEEKRKELKEAVTAVLFAMGKPVERQKLSYALEISEDETAELLQEMMDEQDAAESGLRIIRLEDAYQLCTREKYYDTLTK